MKTSIISAKITATHPVKVGDAVFCTARQGRIISVTATHVTIMWQDNFQIQIIPKGGDNGAR